ncbi:unnamed protein product [Amaranthus hypochondriacus]
MDRISRLPDEVLVRILDYLPTKCAVVTSILSTRWRYLFQLTTNLRFDDERLGWEVVVGNTSTAQKINSQKRRFKKFVYNVLGSHQVSAIKLFSLKTHLSPYSLHHYTWINAAIHKQVQKLYLCFEADWDIKYSPCDDLCTFPLSLFNSKTLVVLQIEFLTHQVEPFLPLEVPTSISLPSLKSLHLKYIKFCDSKSGKRFFSGCLSLEELTLENCRMERKEAWDSMHSNTLKKFTVIDMIYEEWIDIDASSLAYLTIINPGDYGASSMDQLASALVTRIHSVTHLSLLGETLMERYCGLPIFPNVAWLELGRFDFDAWEHFFYLLDNSPRLETIIFREGLLQDMRYVIGFEEELGGEASNSWHAGFIEVYKFTGNENEMGLLKLFLHNAKHLKCLTLHKDCRMKMKDELRIAKELLMLPRASKYCHVQLL